MIFLAVPFFAMTRGFDILTARSFGDPDRCFDFFIIGVEVSFLSWRRCVYY